MNKYADEFDDEERDLQNQQDEIDANELVSGDEKPPDICEVCGGETVLDEEDGIILCAECGNEPEACDCNEVEDFDSGD